MNPRVKAVEPTDDYRLRLTFTNGEIGVFNCSHLVNVGVFREFQEIAYFMRASVAHGTVVWPNEQDICPDTLYEDSIKLTSNNAEPAVAVERRNGACSNGESTHAAH